MSPGRRGRGEERREEDGLKGLVRRREWTGFVSFLSILSIQFLFLNGSNVCKKRVLWGYIVCVLLNVLVRVLYGKRMEPLLRNGKRMELLLAKKLLVIEQ